MQTQVQEKKKSEPLFLNEVDGWNQKQKRWSRKNYPGKNGRGKNGPEKNGPSDRLGKNGPMAQ